MTDGSRGKWSATKSRKLWRGHGRAILKAGKVKHRGRQKPRAGEYVITYR